MILAGPLMWLLGASLVLERPQRLDSDGEQRYDSRRHGMGRDFRLDGFVAPTSFAG